MRMSTIVRVAADILYPATLIFGLYIVVHGHLTPGGGFQGGAVIATSAVLVMVAYQYRDVVGRIAKGNLMARESIGLLLFIGFALIALLYGVPFFTNWLANGGIIFGDPVPTGSNAGDLNTAGTIPLMNIAVGIEVWGGLALIVMYFLSGLEKEGEG